MGRLTRIAGTATALAHAVRSGTNKVFAPVVGLLNTQWRYGSSCVLLGLRLIAFDRGTRIEQQAVTQPLVQTGIAYDLENARIEPGEPDRDAALASALLALHQHLQRGVFDVGHPAHVQRDNARPVLSGQFAYPVRHVLRIDEEQTTLRPQDQQAIERL